MKHYDLPQKLAAQAMRQSDSDIHAKHLRGEFDEGDPNHPKHNNGINYATGLPVSLFGYDTKAFIQRQYRAR